MEAPRHTLVAAVSLCVTFLVTSCAATVPKVTAGSATKLDAGQGVIFGRMAVEKNGQPLTTDNYMDLLHPEVSAHLSPFDGIDKLQRNEWKPGKWFFRANVLKGGYFSTTLPAGKYYFIQFMYVNVVRDNLWLSTYQSTSNVRILRPVVITFEVVPGKTTYIGTLVHKLDNGGVDWPTNVSWALDIADESNEATQWFSAQHPDRKTIETRLAQQTAVH